MPATHILRSGSPRSQPRTVGVIDSMVVPHRCASSSITRSSLPPQSWYSEKMSLDVGGFDISTAGAGCRAACCGTEPSGGTGTFMAACLGPSSRGGLGASVRCGDREVSAAALVVIPAKGMCAVSAPTGKRVSCFDGGGEGIHGGRTVVALYLSMSGGAGRKPSGRTSAQRSERQKNRVCALSDRMCGGEGPCISRAERVAQAARAHLGFCVSRKTRYINSDFRRLQRWRRSVGELDVGQVCAWRLPLQLLLRRRLLARDAHAARTRPALELAARAQLV